MAFLRRVSLTSSRALLNTTPIKLAAPFQQRRFFDLHEFQSKELMDKYSVNCQRWALTESADKAVDVARSLNAKELVIKAQVHAGGRGKGSFPESGLKGGVHVIPATNEQQLNDIVKNMLGYKLVTKQTPKEGVLVNKVMIAESLFFDKEFYFAIVMDRAMGGPVFVGSPHGGMDIEEVAEKTPEAIYKFPIDITKGVEIDDPRTAQMAKDLGFTNIKGAQEQMKRLYDMFIATDATQVEINPFVETTDNKVYSVDAKINFDDNAQFRQSEVFSYRDTSEEDAREVQAQKFGLNYIAMDGNIGCMVNGAGLAMATMDIIKLYDGEPANFLDVGGGATESQVKEAFKIITADANVNALLVNIFGGIMRCDVIAQGIVNAAKEVGLSIPLVVRLEGTNVEIGQQILSESGLPITTAVNLDDAAQKAVKAVNSS